MMEKNYKGNHSNKVADNRLVVPYNPYLLLKFNSHIKEVHPVKEITDRFKVNSIY